MSFLTQNGQFVTVLQPDADRYAASPATQAINMKLYDHVTFFLCEGAGGAGTCTITVEECTTAAGAGNVAIPFRYRLSSTIDTWAEPVAVTVAATGYTTIAGANKMIAVEIDAEELAEDHPFVRLQLTVVVATAVDAGVVAVCTKPRYSRSVMPTAIA